MKRTSDGVGGREKNLFITWVCICDRCHSLDVLHQGQLIGRHARWIGEPPKITRILT